MVVAVEVEIRRWRERKKMNMKTNGSLGPYIVLIQGYSSNFIGTHVKALEIK